MGRLWPRWRLDLERHLDKLLRKLEVRVGRFSLNVVTWRSWAKLAQQTLKQAPKYHPVIIIVVSVVRDNHYQMASAPVIPEVTIGGAVLSHSHGAGTSRWIYKMISGGKRCEERKNLQAGFAGAGRVCDGLNLCECKRRRAKADEQAWGFLPFGCHLMIISR